MLSNRFLINVLLEYGKLDNNIYEEEQVRGRAATFSITVQTLNHWQ